MIRDALSSKSVDEEVLDYVRDVLLDLAFDEEEEDARDVETMTENIGPMVEAFLTEKEVADVCARVVERLRPRAEGATARETKEKQRARRRPPGKFLIDLLKHHTRFSGEDFIETDRVTSGKEQKIWNCRTEWGGKNDVDESNRGERYFGVPGGCECDIRETRDFEFIERFDEVEFAKEKEEENGDGKNASSSLSSSETCLREVGFDDKMMGKRVNELSGGWRMRLAIAAAMTQQVDMLLLDEPTNHLDVDAVEWLANFLIASKSTVLVVSHDYDFLTKVCTDIIHFENQKLTMFDGGFPGFRAKKPNLVLPRMKKETLDAISKHAEENGLVFNDGSNDLGDASSLDKSKELARREALGLENTAGLVSAMNKGAMTIGGSNGINKNKMNGCGGGEQGSSEKPLLVFPDPGALDGIKNRSQVVMRLDDVTFKYDGGEKNILEQVCVRAYLGSRVAIVGANGAGKTTLMKNIVGEIEPQSGTIWKHHNLRIAYVSQHSMHHLETNLHLTPKEYIPNALLSRSR